MATLTFPAPVGSATSPLGRLRSSRTARRSMYEYTVFLSYHRGRRVDLDGQVELSAAGRWVHEVLHPELERWLPEADPDARIAFDGDLPPGERSDDALKGLISKSRCMLAVWSPLYFRSDWCRAEWHSMLARERQHSEQSLVIPIRFSDGIHFDPEATRRCGGEVDRMRQFTSLLSGHTQHQRWPDFVDEVKRCCEHIVARARHAPDWSDDFPWTSPGALPATTMSSPSLRSGGLS